MRGYATVMARRDQLAEYRSKRDLSRSGEPSGPRKGRSRKGRRFVVQRHDASTLHFDFRLQVGDVLVSWSVPKGPSLDPRDKRLAVRTEDHPLDYAEFEGRIPDGEYGAGTVVVWDTGTYRNLTDLDMPKAVADGHLVVWLDGHKLTGAFALIKTEIRGQEPWLLIKQDDEGADRRRKPATAQPDSVLTGRTNEELAEG
jgi:DNA ligase D-like protein (predicted 3'-phosphoesterase)